MNRKRINQAILDRYRCPEQFVRSRLRAPLSEANRSFKFGGDTYCYGQSSSKSGTQEGSQADLIEEVQFEGSELLLSFDPTQVIDNLRLEEYLTPKKQVSSQPLQDLYYFIRPLLPTGFRRRLQRIYFRGWEKISFPRWPLDMTVEQIFERLLLLGMKAAKIETVPFIWFWPDGYSSAAVVTHDVETIYGRNFCSRLMDINESFNIQASFQVVPEKRYSIPVAFLDEIRRRGNEINIHDLNHDGRLFHDRLQFESRVKRINQYGREFEAKGFRAAVLYRNPKWFDLLEFDYDMSFPNIGHLEAQRGGCCTVFPYFIGNILEIPVTTTQDYSLFHMFRRFDLDLWKTQAQGIMERHGLLSFLTHPDYLRDEKAQATYRGLLSLLSQYRSEQGMWMTTPGEINTWWRQRSQMSLVRQDHTWRIEGPGKERARIAYARSDGGKLVYTLDELCAKACATTSHPRLSSSGLLSVFSAFTFLIDLCREIPV
jgi:hypothetical protein